jgi:hypothetical protein
MLMDRAPHAAGPADGWLLIELTIEPSSSGRRPQRFKEDNILGSAIALFGRVQHRWFVLIFGIVRKVGLYEIVKSNLVGISGDDRQHPGWRRRKFLIPWSNSRTAVRRNSGQVSRNFGH